MNRIISENMDKIRELCRQHRVKSLYLFGSAVSDDQFTVNSDIDLLVKFDSKYFKGISKTYFNLIGELEKAFNKNVDLVTEDSLKNPYFIESVNQHKVLLYEA